MPKCPRCGKVRRRSEFPDGFPRQEYDSCVPCWRQRYAVAAMTHASLVRKEPVKVDGGWRTAVFVDGGREKWLCRHIHRTKSEAEACIQTSGSAGKTPR